MQHHLLSRCINKQSKLNAFKRLIQQNRPKVLKYISMMIILEDETTPSQILTPYPVAIYILTESERFLRMLTKVLNNYRNKKKNRNEIRVVDSVKLTLADKDSLTLVP